MTARRNSRAPCENCSAHPREPSLLLRAVWSIVILLAVVGVSAAIGRALFPADLLTYVEPVRSRMLVLLHIIDPFAAERPAELLRVDGRFAVHPLLTLMHVVPGGILLLLAPLQRRQVSRHREWMIRAFASALAISTVRVVAPVFDATLTPAGFRPPVIFVITLWTGWIITLAAAEAWIRYTRPARVLPRP